MSDLNTATPPKAAGQHSSVDRSRLESWFQVEHLGDRALEKYRNAFSLHPARLVVLENVLAPQVADRLAKFLGTEAEFSPEFGLYSTEGAVTEQAWLGADDQDRFFRLRKLVGTPSQFKMSPNALTYLLFRRAFQLPEFKAFFETISGLSLGWSDDFGAHSMIEGDFLRPHSDDNRNRRLALVIYLSPEWQRQFGGLLRVFHHDGSFTEVEPHFNSMIVFDVLAAPAHLVTAITTTGQQRLSIGGWYHST
jgi:2OG-Fe(II) oxygenase superfamily